MEKNWIKETREFIHKAMNKGLKIGCEKCNKFYEFWITDYEGGKGSVESKIGRASCRERV